MEKLQNPFEYEAANNLRPQDIIDYYIEDFNFSRFIQSTKNIFLIGERGSGKTMALLYNSIYIKNLREKNNSVVSFDKVGIHIPCNTPLFMKKEYLLVSDDFKKAIISEHFLVLSILYSIADSLSRIDEVVNALEEVSDCLFDDLEYMWNICLDRNSGNLFKAVKKFVNRENIATQKKINAFDSDSFYDNALSFSSSVLPFLQTLRQIEILKDSHFMLMLDDAHDMNEYQIKALNSWIAYRDHSLFSFKVATAKVDRPISITSTGGSILEGHDYITVDMEQAYQNAETSFYKLSKKIVEKRLQSIGIKSKAEEFFPMNQSLEKDFEHYKKQAKAIGIEKFGDNNTKAVSDYVYKYYRAMYFRDRKDKANNPPYSGFEMIVAISTGVVRNMLVPCYWMYDNVMNTEKEQISCIPPKIQTNILVEQSKKMWEMLLNGLDKVVSDCTSYDAIHIYNLFTNLSNLFSLRLKMDISEPRAIVFSISQVDSFTKEYNEVTRLLRIAQKAQFLYTRIGNAKEKGKQEIYYVPNRMLFPSVGLDPQGQHSRTSLKTIDLYNAAFHNTAFKIDSVEKNNVVQRDLFYDYE